MWKLGMGWDGKLFRHIHSGGMTNKLIIKNGNIWGVSWDDNIGVVRPVQPFFERQKLQKIRIETHKY